MRGVAAFSLAVLLAAAFATMAGSGPHTLHAQGAHGWVKFWADGPGTVRVAGKGSLTVENASNQQMKVDGTWGEMRKLPDGAAYTHFEGSVECIGIGAHIEMLHTAAMLLSAHEPTG